MSRKPFAFDGAYRASNIEKANSSGFVSFFSDEPIDVRERPLCGEWSGGSAPAEDLTEGMEDYKRSSEAPEDEDLKELISALPHNKK